MTQPPPGSLGLQPELSAIITMFLDHNPEASLGGDTSSPVIDRPWGDPSLAIRLPWDVALISESLRDALTNLYLPQRFSAVYHVDTRDLEFIYNKVSPDNPYRSRSFAFAFRSQNYSCAFADASQRLLALAEAIFPTNAMPYTYGRCGRTDLVLDQERRMG